MSFFSRYFYNIEKYLLYLMVLTIPIDALPKRYHFPDAFRNVHYIILVMAILVAIIYLIRTRKSFHIPQKLLKMYLLLCCIWPILCTILGVLNFPYWDEQAEEFLRNTSMVQRIAVFYPDVIYSNTLLHLKYCATLILNTIHDFLFLYLAFLLYFM